MHEVLADVFHQNALFVLSDLAVDEVVQDAVGYGVSVQQNCKDFEVILKRFFIVALDGLQFHY